MRVVDHVAAPDHLGCLAWDGSTYWAATRRNTRDSGEPAHLYRLDRTFKIIDTMDTPGVGCQGLAWDGQHLWFADVFNDAIYVLDVRGESMRIVHTAFSELSYLSGVAMFDGEIWITDYNKHHLSRLRPGKRIAWKGVGGTQPETALAPAIAPAVPSRSAKHVNPSARRPADDAEELEWSVQLSNNAIWGSWKLWFGTYLFVENTAKSDVVSFPRLARYEVTVQRPDGLENKLVYDARPGENQMNEVMLGDATLPGEYRVSLFIHVQHVTSEGTGRILNNSAGSLTVRQ